MSLGRNETCYCGSGKKYKVCCMAKDNEKKATEHAIKNQEKNINERFFGKSVPEELNEVFQHEAEIFKEMYDREQGPDDPVMASAIGKSPEEIAENLIPIWLKEGLINERIAYAIRKTSNMVH